MITPYRKNQRKIAMGLLGFHQNLKEQQHLLHEIDTYEDRENFKLYCYYHEEESNNVQGIIGISIEPEQRLILHDISLNPSFRGEKISYQMMAELVDLYPDYQLEGTLLTADFLNNWRQKDVTNEHD